MQLAKFASAEAGAVYVLPEAAESYQRNYRHLPFEIIDGLCGYDIGAGWHPAKCGNPEPCPQHSALKCFCGAGAKGACPHAGSFVCGAPVCVEHGSGCNRHRHGG